MVTPVGPYAGPVPPPGCPDTTRGIRRRWWLSHRRGARRLGVASCRRMNTCRGGRRGALLLARLSQSDSDTFVTDGVRRRSGDDLLRLHARFAAEGAMKVGRVWRFLPTQAEPVPEAHSFPPTEALLPAQSINRKKPPVHRSARPTIPCVAPRLLTSFPSRSGRRGSGGERLHARLLLQWDAIEAN